MVQSQYFRGNMTKLKMVLPVGKPRAWSLIATTKGLASWFPAKCKGNMEPGDTLTFTWRDGTEEKFGIVYMGEKHSAFRIEWRNGAQIRIYLHGRMTTLTLEIHYPRNKSGRENQIRELAQWSFYLANLKSIALGGPDLRHRLRGRSGKQGFID